MASVLVSYSPYIICMVLFLPVFDCVEWLCTVHVYRGMKRVLCYLEVFKEGKRRLYFLAMYPSPCSRTGDVGPMVLALMLRGIC